MTILNNTPKELESQPNIEAPRPLSSRIVVLNVDDSEAGRFAVTRMLEHAGFEVWEATTGQEALQLAERGPDIILLDVRLPDIDGFEVCRRIKSNPKSASSTVIHLTARSIATSDKVQGLEGGADGYLTEPISSSELIATLRSFVRTRKTEAALRFMAEASAVLSASLEIDHTLVSLADLAVPFLADWCIVARVDDDGTIKHVAMTQLDSNSLARRVDVQNQALPASQPRHGVIHVVDTREPLMLTEIPSVEWLCQALGFDCAKFAQLFSAGSYMCVPLLARGRTVGVMSLVVTGKSRKFGRQDLALAQDLAARAAICVDNARLYQSSMRAIQTRESLLALVSHDLKTPLGTIMLSHALITNELGEDPRFSRTQRHLEIIQRAADRMNRLIGDLLDLSAVDAGQLTMRCQPENVQSLLDEAMEIHMPLAAEKKLRLLCTVEVPTAHINCDRQRVQQVLGNLITNAIKFTDVGGTIVLHARRVEQVVEFTVTDTGAGIHPDDMSYLFDRFWQASKTSHLGSGLGLSIVKALVEAQGGSIAVESTPGKGSRFSFRIPAVEKSA